MPNKWLYLWLDRFFGAATLKSSLQKVFVDVYLQGTVFMLPTFYLWTGAMKGQSLQQSAAQYRSEAFDATIGTAGYWTPLMFANFQYVPQHSRVFMVACLSFIHKTWLSWLSNRGRHQERLTQDCCPDRTGTGGGPADAAARRPWAPRPAHYALCAKH